MYQNAGILTTNKFNLCLEIKHFILLKDFYFFRVAILLG